MLRKGNGGPATLDSKSALRIEAPRNLTDADFWNGHWRRVKPRRFARFNYFDYRFHLECKAIVRSGDRVLEVGCGGSRWMGYLERELGAEVWGVDYAREGVDQVRLDLSKNAQRRVILGDFFSVDELPRETFSTIYSLGFLEHFPEPVTVTRRMFELLKPGGCVLSVIPNFTGPYGWLQKTFGPEVYDKHLVMDRAELDHAHESAGLVAIKPAGYFFCFGPLVVSYASTRDRCKPLSSVVLLFTKLLQQAVNWVLWGLHLRFETRTLSPSILGIYQKPSTGEAVEP